MFVDGGGGGGGGWGGGGGGGGGVAVGIYRHSYVQCTSTYLAMYYCAPGLRTAQW